MCWHDIWYKFPTYLYDSYLSQLPPSFGKVSTNYILPSLTMHLEQSPLCSGMVLVVSYGPQNALGTAALKVVVAVSVASFLAKGLTSPRERSNI